MKNLALASIGLALMLLIVPVTTLAGSGSIQRACQSSNRTAASPTLCRCIQNVAEVSLSRSEMKRVAKFFSDPHQAQVVRQSDRRSDEILWKKYKAFGEQARATCS